METKQCTKCKEVKPVGEFGTEKRHRSGLQSWCRSCDAQNTRVYYSNHRETCLAHTKVRRESNIEKNTGGNPFTEEFKKCPMCHENRPMTKDNWDKVMGTFDGLGSYCKDCVCIKNIHKNSQSRGENIFFPRGLTGKVLRELKKKQNFLCYLCGRKENGDRLHLDHNHVAGIIRGYACGFCNRFVLSGFDYIKRESPDQLAEFYSPELIRKITVDYPAKYLYETT